MRYIFLGVLLVLCYLITACGGSGNSATADPVTGTPVAVIVATEPAASGLPAIGDLPRPTTGTAVTHLTGAGYDADLLHSRVAVDGHQAVFSPAGTTSADAAFAVYAFNLTGITSEQEIYTYYANDWGFTTEPICSWIGLSNWERRCWDWFPAMESDHVMIGNTSPYTHPDDCTCHVVMLFQAEAEIHLASLGFKTSSSAPPVIESVFPPRAITGNETIFSATITGSGPLTYSWNFGEGASPSTSTAAEPHVVAGNLGEYNCSLTVSNGSGSVELPFTLAVSSQPGDWTHTYSLPNMNDMLQTIHHDHQILAVDSNGYSIILAKRRFIDETSGLDTTECSLIKLDPSGVIAWSYSYRLGEVTDFEEVIDNLWVDHDNNIYLTGWDIFTEGEKCYLVKLDQAGTPVWTRVCDRETCYTGNASTLQRGVCDSENNIYVTGWLHTPEHTGIQGASRLLKFSPVGEYLGSSVWIGRLPTASGANAPSYIIIDNQDNIFISGLHTQMSSAHGFIARFNTDLELQDSAPIDTGDQATTIQLSADNEMLYVAHSGFSKTGKIWAYTWDLDCQWGRLFDQSDLLYSLDIAPFIGGSGGSILISGHGMFIEDDVCRRNAIIARVLPDGSLDWLRRRQDVDIRSDITMMAPTLDGGIIMQGYTDSGVGIWSEITPEIMFSNDYVREYTNFKIVEITAAAPDFEEYPCYREARDYDIDSTGDYEQHLLIHSTL